METPVKAPRHSRSKSIETLNSENSNPNIGFSSPRPSLKPKKSPSSKSAPAKKSVSKTPSRALDFPVLVPAPPVPRPGRKFIVTKKTQKRKDGSLDFNKCRAEAYEALQASQQEFFRKEKSEITKPVIKVVTSEEKMNGSGEKLETLLHQTTTGSLIESVMSNNEVCKIQKSRSSKKSQGPKIGPLKKNCSGIAGSKEAIEKSKALDAIGLKTEIWPEIDGSDIAGSVDKTKILDVVELKTDHIPENPKSKALYSPKTDSCEELEIENLEGSSKVRKMRSLAMNKAIDTMPDPGSGRVKHLVHAFESLQLIKKTEESEKQGEEQEERKQRVKNWALPGLQPIVKPTDNGSAPVSLSSSAELISFAGLERDSSKAVYSSLDTSSNRSSYESRTTGAGRRSRRNSSDSLRSWTRKLKVTSQHPFKLRTEQRGRKKEEEFVKKVEEMILEEQKMRIPIAQGLPWTTDEPECLVKPPVKERTEPLEIVLHSDVRAVDRAEFDHYVCERLKYAEELRLQREMQRKMEEEEEIKRLRKELVPKAQPMPYFDRPFIPKRSTKSITVPKEPSFHVRPGKLSCVSTSMASSASMIDLDGP